MANAKRCDICGKYYQVPDHVPGMLPDNYINRVDFVMIHKAEDKEESMYFDRCKKCQQDILDYILSRQADREANRELPTSQTFYI